jgi:hypothetical protein
MFIISEELYKDMDTMRNNAKKTNRTLVRIIPCHNKPGPPLWAGRKKPEKKDPLNPRISAGFWRREWDSNPRALARKLISSQPRYDHFDIPPYAVGK